MPRGTHRDGIHSRGASSCTRFPRSVLPFLLLRLVRRHTRALLLERTRFYLSLSPVNGLWRAPRRVFGYSSFSLTPQRDSQSLSLFLFSLRLSYVLSCISFSLYSSFESGPTKIGPDDAIGTARHLASLTYDTIRASHKAGR